MSGPARIGEPGSIRFTFDGRDLLARPGDTLAAALLANGIRNRAFRWEGQSFFL